MVKAPKQRDSDTLLVGVGVWCEEELAEYQRLRDVVPTPGKEGYQIEAGSSKKLPHHFPPTVVRSFQDECNSRGQPRRNDKPLIQNYEGPGVVATIWMNSKCTLNVLNLRSWSTGEWQTRASEEPVQLSLPNE